MNDTYRNKRNGFETVDFSGKQNDTSWGKALKWAIGICVVLILVFNSTYQIKEQEQAVLVTFGNAKAVTEPGLHFKIPFIQQVKKVNTTIQGFAIGFDEKTGATKEDGWI